MKLSNRLRVIAQFVSPGARIVDVGTDHAYLPAWLVTTGVCASAIATDVRPGPVKRARETVAGAGLTDRIDVRLTDGLQGVPSAAADTVILAGMGGETIAGILSRAGWDWTRKSLILQPMSKQALLCTYLEENGFAVCDEALVEDGGALYRVLLARPGAWQISNAAWRYAGAPLLERRDPLLPAYLAELTARMERALAGMEAGKTGERPRAEAMREALAALYAMKGETERW